ncbi:hypothetical protein QL285_012450 [Trifolium repens]|nr:hypothetical protein QL285_012450 [Trifolium repens]
MVDEEVDNATPRIDPMEDPTLSWVGPEPRGTASVITPTLPDVFGILEEKPEEENFTAYAPKPWRRICSEIPDIGCYMYEVVFKHQGLRLPFSPLAIEVFKHLKLAPSQLHPNSMAFIIAFDRLCEYHSVAPTKELFFRVFKLQRQTNDEGQRSWVSLKQRVTLFEIYVDSVRGYKSRYYFVKPTTEFGILSMYTREPDVGADGVVKVDEDGRERTKLVPRFPMNWSKEHFEEDPKYYLTREEDMSDGDLASLAKLVKYVRDFRPARWETRDGKPVLDKFGREQFSPRLIATKKLLECKSRAEASIFLGIFRASCSLFIFLLPSAFSCVVILDSPRVSNLFLSLMFCFAENMSSIADRLLKIASQEQGKKKKKTSKGRMGAVLAHSGSGPVDSSSPGGASSSAIRENPSKRQRQEDDLVDLTIPEHRPLEQRFVVPGCYGVETYFEKCPPLVTAEEKKLITEMSAAETEAQLARDVAGVMRIWETALVLTESKGDAGRELAKARDLNGKLEARLAKAEGDLLDYKGKYEVFVEQSRELRETKEAMVKLEGEVKALKLQVEAEQKEKEDLISAMKPTADETEATNAFSSRAELVKEILALRQDTIEAASYAFTNVVEQLKIANPGVELVTEGTGMLYQVKDGRIVVPEVYQRMEDEDGEEEDDDQERQDESEHGEEGA